VATEDRWTFVASASTGRAFLRYGQSGAVVSDCFDLTYADLVSASHWTRLRPLVTLVKFGLNDASSISTTEFNADLTQLCTELLRIGHTPVLVKNIQLPDTYTGYVAENAEIVSYDDEKDAVASALGLGVIDLCARFGAEIAAENKDYYIADGNPHYNATGHGIVADEVETWLSSNGYL